MSHNSSSDRPTIKPEATSTREPRRLGKIGVTGVAAVALASVVVTGNVWRESKQEHETRLKMIKQIDTPIFDTIVLRGGTQLRLTPKFESFSASTGDTGNLAGEIPKDEAWVVQAPLVDLEKPEWIAVTKPGTENDIKNMDDRADNTVWIHHQALTAGVVGEESRFDWKFNDNGSTSVNGELTPIIGSTFKVDADSVAVVQGLVTNK